MEKKDLKYALAMIMVFAIFAFIVLMILGAVMAIDYHWNAV